MDSINDIKNSLKSIFKDEVKLYSLKGVEKTSLFLGIIASFFIITIFILLGMVFGSIALANYLNIKLDHNFMGFLIVAGIDLLLAIILLFWVVKRKTPLLTNLFIKAIISIFNIREDEDK